MDWQAEKYDWPNAGQSQFVENSGMNWHVQQSGTGETVLLLHGSGASAHSFVPLMNELDTEFSLAAIDLPGHGFTSTLRKRAPTLGNVAAGVGDLLKVLELEPDYIIAHSAGAAIGAEMIHRGKCNPKALFAINGAFYPFPGMSGHIFPAVAKVLFLNPLVPAFFASSASENRVSRLLDSTGSTLDETQIGYYRKLFSSSRHVSGTLAMMANWNLQTMEDKLAGIDCPVHLLIGSRDGTIEPAISIQTLQRLKHGKREIFEGFGHLVHEETPAEVASYFRQAI
ncbi:MAG: alpha/beta fold hydrolase BchO [Pseudomonadota bacterium]